MALYLKLLSWLIIAIVITSAVFYAVLRFWVWLIGKVLTSEDLNHDD